MSFLELVSYIFSQPGVTSFLSQRLCQDPIEKFFSCQRQRGGTNENPTVPEFYENTQGLRVVNSFCKHNASGNCRGGMEEVGQSNKENRLLNKRRSHRHYKLNVNNFQLNHT